MTHRIVLPDGGELVYDGRSRIAPVGDRGIPESVVYRHSGDARRPACEIRIEVWDGVPVVADVKLTARREDGVAIKAKDIKLGPALNLDGLVAGWLAEVAHRPEPAPPGRRRWSKSYPVSADERRAAMKTVEGARSQTRRRLTNAQLRIVADVYNNTPANTARHEAVAAAFNVGPRTAQRYIEKSRAAGYLPPTAHGKTN